MATHAPGRTEPSNPSIEVVHRAEESAANNSSDAALPNSGYEDVVAQSSSTGSADTPQPDSKPEPLMPPGTSVEVDNVAPPAWRMPVYARYRLLSIGAVIIPNGRCKF